MGRLVDTSWPLAGCGGGTPGGGSAGASVPRQEFARAFLKSAHGRVRFVASGQPACVQVGLVSSHRVDHHALGRVARASDLDARRGSSLLHKYGRVACCRVRTCQFREFFRASSGYDAGGFGRARRPCYDAMSGGGMRLGLFRAGSRRHDTAALRQERQRTNGIVQVSMARLV